MASATETKISDTLPEAESLNGDRGIPAWLEIDWRNHLRSIEIFGSRVSYVDIGEGDPIVFVHGLGGAWQNWLENIPYFARQNRVVALDLPGFGQSEMPVETISMPGYAKLIAELCKQLGFERIRIVGNSMGGLIAAETAILFPELIDRLTLVSPAGISSAWVRPEPILMAARVIHRTSGLVSRILKDAARRPGFRKLAMGRVVYRPAALRPELVYEQLKGGTDHPGLLLATRAILAHDFRGMLGQIGAPTLIAWGRQDRMISAWDAKVFERLISNARRVIYDKAGHMAQLERPAEFNRLVDEFHAGPVAAAAGETNGQP